MTEFKYQSLLRFIYLTLFLISTFDGQLQAAFEERLYSTRARALGGAYAALINGQSAIFGNSSSLGYGKNRRVNILYGRSNGLKELANSGVSVPLPLKWGNIEIGLSRFGFSLYHENIVSVGIGQKLSKNSAIGFTLRYLSTEIRGYGSASALGMDAGLSLKLNQFMNIGLTAKNINAPRLSSSEKSLARSIRLGASFALVEHVLLITEYHKEENQTTIYRVGSEIEILSEQFLRFGISNNPSSFSLGFGFSFNKIDLSYSFNTHQYLDASQFLSFGIIF